MYFILIFRKAGDIFMENRLEKHDLCMSLDTTTCQKRQIYSFNREINATSGGWRWSSTFDCLFWCFLYFLFDFELHFPSKSCTHTNLRKGFMSLGLDISSICKCCNVLHQQGICVLEMLNTIEWSNGLIRFRHIRHVVRFKP